MYAIVDIAGQQFKVEKKQKLFVHRLPEEEGKSIELSKVLLIDNNDKVLVGAPLLDEAVVTAKVLEHTKGDKVLVFKKKRRKGYQKLNGHRQYLTRIEIQGIYENKADKKEEPVEESKPKKEKKESAAKAETK